MPSSFSYLRRTIVQFSGSSLVATALVAAGLTANFASTSLAQEQAADAQTHKADNQNDPKSNRMFDEHADDESPKLGVIIGSCPGKGVCVLDTVWGSPADEAGIVHGDYILSLNGTDVSSPGELIDAIKRTKGGDKAQVKVWRQGETLQRELTLASKADEPPASHRSWLGVMLASTENEEGVKIERVMRGSPAAKADLRSGDVIVKRDDSEIFDMRSLADNIGDMQPRSKLQLTIQRNGKRIQKQVTVGDIDDAPMQFIRRAEEAIRSMKRRDPSEVQRDEASSTMEGTLDEMRQRIRQLEKEVREMKSGEDVSQRSSSLGSRGTTLVVQRDRWPGRDRGRWNRGRDWDNDFYDWRSRYRSGYRSPLNRSPRYGNYYYRYGGRPYYGNFGQNYGYGRTYGFGRGGVRIGNLGVWW